MEKLCTVQYTQHGVTIYCTTSALIEIIVILQHGKYFYIYIHLHLLRFKLSLREKNWHSCNYLYPVSKTPNFTDVSVPIFISTSNHPSSFSLYSCSCPDCCSTESPPSKEWSHQPMTPCWDMWHFHCYTSHLPKLACITLSHEQLNCMGGWQGVQVERVEAGAARWVSDSFLGRGVQSWEC